MSTVTGEAFLQPVSFIATDNVVLCTLRSEYSSTSLEALFFIRLMLNTVNWRYSYGRQCYRRKYASTQIVLPVTVHGEIDWAYMEGAVINTPYWQLVSTVFSAAHAADKRQHSIAPHPTLFAAETADANSGASSTAPITYPLQKRGRRTGK